MTKHPFISLSCIASALLLLFFFCRLIENPIWVFAPYPVCFVLWVLSVWIELLRQ